MRVRPMGQARVALASTFLVLSLLLLFGQAHAAKTADAINSPAVSASVAPSSAPVNSSSSSPTPVASATEGQQAAVALSPGSGPRRDVPKPKTPSAEQVKAFGKLTDEAKIYADSAKDFRRVLTMIVRHGVCEGARRYALLPTASGTRLADILKVLLSTCSCMAG